jgi:hypothetical protein
MLAIWVSTAPGKQDLTEQTVVNLWAMVYLSKKRTISLRSSVFPTEIRCIFALNNGHKIMHTMNITIYRADSGLSITQGSPDDLGLAEAAVYVNFIYERTEILVWVSCPLSAAEKKIVSRGILDYLKQSAFTTVKQLGLIAN